MNDINKTIINYRLEQSNKSFKDAKILYKNNGEYFSIINRCYYAMFYSILGLLIKTDFIGSKHSGVISYFDKNFIKTGIFKKELSQIIHKAFKMRNTGDYDEFVEFSKVQIDNILHDTEKFLINIKEYIQKNY